MIAQEKTTPPDSDRIIFIHCSLGVLRGFYGARSNTWFILSNGYANSAKMAHGVISWA